MADRGTDTSTEDNYRIFTSHLKIIKANYYARLTQAKINKEPKEVIERIREEYNFEKDQLYKQFPVEGVNFDCNDSIRKCFSGYCCFFSPFCWF